MITKRQKEVLDFVTKYQKRKGYAPSLEEICKKFKLASVSTAHFHISKLHDLGYLTKDIDFGMTLKVQVGFGYQPAIVRKNLSDEATLSVGVLQLDATYSPVQRVMYHIESARVENRTDLDKLIIVLETDEDYVTQILEENTKENIEEEK